MNLEQMVTEVGLRMGVTREVMDSAILWARITAPDSARMSKQMLNPDEEHMARMLFHAVLYKIANDPEYRKNMEREMKERIQRN